MVTPVTRKRRRGSILPLVVICMVALFGMVALAIDIGMIAVAKTQAQNAADAAAWRGTRDIPGTTNPDISTAQSNAKDSAAANNILGKAIDKTKVTTHVGVYYYNASLTSTDPNYQKFYPYYPDTDGGMPTGERYTLMRVSVGHTDSLGFAPVLGISQFGVNAAATAAYRPRDVVMVFDFSGSMDNQSDFYNAEGYLGAQNNTPNNADTVVPKFGSYSASYTNLIQTNPDLKIGICNITTTALDVPALVDDFFQNNVNAASGIKAFTNVTYTNLNTPPAGDVPLFAQGSTSTFAKTLYEAQLNTSTGVMTNWTGYTNFQGFTRGPGYWGQTFVIWPPDTNTANDWRFKFLLQGDGTSFSTSAPFPNLNFWDASGNNPNFASNGVSTTFRLNYPAILNWINTKCLKTAGSTTDNQPFPTKLRAGRCLYYDAVPTDVPSANYDFNTSNTSITSGNPASTDPSWNQRFWKEYIDFVFGNYKDFAGGWQDPASPTMAYAPDYTWGTSVMRNLTWGPTGAGNVARNSGTPNNKYQANYNAVSTGIRVVFTTAPQAGQLITFTDDPNNFYLISSVTSLGSNAYTLKLDRNIRASSPDILNGTNNATLSNTHVHYQDNPKRGQNKYWFGAITMIQFMLDTGILPGTAHNISLYPGKLGIAGALKDIQTNHPADKVAYALYNRPVFSGATFGAFTKPKWNLDNDYQSMIDALWYPPNSGSSGNVTDVRPWDNNAKEIARCHGDFTGNTTSDFGFIMAYNILSGNSTLVANGYGGKGRKGSSKLIIFETDGMANVGTSITNPLDTTGGVGNYFYKIRPGTDTFNAGSHSDGALLTVVQRICNKDDGTQYPPVNTLNTTPNPNPTDKGYGTARKRVVIHTLAYGPVIAPGGDASQRNAIIPLLKDISSIGGTTFPDTAADANDGYKWVYGDLDDLKTKLKTAILKIMQGQGSIPPTTSISVIE